MIFYIIGIVLLSIILGLIIGIFLSKLKYTMEHRKILKEGIMVINGEKKNETYDLNGKIISVNKFRIIGENGKDILISFGGKVDENKEIVISAEGKEKIGMNGLDNPEIKEGQKIPDEIKERAKKNGKKKKAS